MCAVAPNKRMQLAGASGLRNVDCDQAGKSPAADARSVRPQTSRDEEEPHATSPPRFLFGPNQHAVPHSGPGPLPRTLEATRYLVDPTCDGVVAKCEPGPGADLRSRQAARSAVRSET